MPCSSISDDDFLLDLSNRSTRAAAQIVEVNFDSAADYALIIAA